MWHSNAWWILGLCSRRCVWANKRLVRYSNWLSARHEKRGELWERISVMRKSWINYGKEGFLCHALTELKNKCDYIYIYTQIWVQIICHENHGEGRKQWAKRRKKKQCTDSDKHASFPIFHVYVIGYPSRSISSLWAWCHWIPQTEVESWLKRLVKRSNPKKQLNGLRVM